MKTWEDNFQFGSYLIEDTSCTVTIHHLADCRYPSNDFFWVGGPSTWDAVSIFTRLRGHFPQITERGALTLASQVLGIGFEELVAKIQWNENYMRWHDGDATYRVLDGEY